MRHTRSESATARAYIRQLDRTRLSKFQPCLGERLELELLARALVDLAGTQRLVQSA